MSGDFATRQPDGIWIIDDTGKTVFANETMAEILGTTSLDLMGTDSFLFVFPEDLPEAQRLFSSKQAGSSAPFHFKAAACGRKFGLGGCAGNPYAQRVGGGLPAWWGHSRFRGGRTGKRSLPESVGFS